MKQKGGILIRVTLAGKEAVGTLTRKNDNVAK